MSAKAYIEQAIAALRKMMSSQGENFSRAADLLQRAITGGKSIFSFGASHSFILTEELVYRTGGLMLVNPIYPHGMNLFVRPMTLTSKLERVAGLGRELLESSPAREGDVLIIASTSGRNSVVIDMALAARENKIGLVGITSLEYSRGVNSRHPSGKKLADLCDVVIDNAVVEIPGFPQKVGPLSTLTGVAAVNAVAAEVVSRLVRRGVQPPVFMSANIDGADEYNARLLEENRQRIHYMQ
jgi:uncharacterized phosphosugar-binding protein